MKSVSNSKKSAHSPKGQSAGAGSPRHVVTHCQESTSRANKSAKKANLGLLVGLALGALSIQGTSQAFPFQNNTASVAHWFNTRKYSNDPTLRVRVRNLYDCSMKINENARSYYMPAERLFCNAYADYVDGEYPSGTTCKVSLEYYISSKGDRYASITPHNQFCFRRLDWI